MGNHSRSGMFRFDLRLLVLGFFSNAVTFSVNYKLKRRCKSKTFNSPKQEHVLEI